MKLKRKKIKNNIFYLILIFFLILQIILILHTSSFSIKYFKLYESKCWTRRWD